MARKRKHSSTVHQSPPALPAMPQVTAQSSAGHSMAVDFDSDSPMGSPDSCSSRSGASSACSPSSKTEKPPMVRSAANARERSRMRVLSKAFSRLKTTLPWVPADTKLSKLDTLRLASCYIAHLREILADDKPASSLPTDSAAAKAVSAATGGKKTGSGAQTPIHPLNLTWPFTFNGRVSLTSTSFSDVTSRQKDSLHVTTNKTPITGSS